MNLEVIEGFIQGGRFIMTSIAGMRIEGSYKSQGLRLLATLIDEDEAFSFTIGNDKYLKVPVQINGALKRDLFKIANALEE